MPGGRGGVRGAAARGRGERAASHRLVLVRLASPSPLPPPQVAQANEFDIDRSNAALADIAADAIAVAEAAREASPPKGDSPAAAPTAEAAAASAAAVRQLVEMFGVSARSADEGKFVPFVCVRVCMCDAGALRSAEVRWGEPRGRRRRAAPRRACRRGDGAAAAAFAPRPASALTDTSRTEQEDAISVALAVSQWEQEEEDALSALGMPAAPGPRPASPAPPAARVAPPTRQTPLASQPREAGTWPCAACTFVNAADAKDCAVCESPGPRAAPLPAPAPRLREVMDMELAQQLSLTVHAETADRKVRTRAPRHPSRRVHGQ